MSKSKGQVILEYILLGVCLCVIGLRATFTEGPSVQSANQPINQSDIVYSLSVSAMLALSFVVWLVWSFCSKRFLYRFTAIETGLCVFTIAAIAAGFAAADKRAAITDFVVLISPVLCAVLLVQILDSQSKIKLVLAVVAALGVVSAHQCAEQFFVSNQLMIEQYEQSPQSLLEPLGIKMGTFEQMLFEHRLYSRGVRSFFTTSNSAGSFALLASFAAIALFIDKLRNRKPGSSGPLYLWLCGIAGVVGILGLAITQSKGAISASLIAVAMFAAYLLFGNWLKVHRKAVFIVCLLLVLAGGCAVVLYGLTYDRLPGGNSMLVRWQYWRASGRMYAEHPLTGVGPGNFVYFYPRYKPAGAPETVADPHDFLLTVLTQYGPVGLAGFLAMIFVPLMRVISRGPVSASIRANGLRAGFKKLAVPYVIVISLGLLVIRPIVMPVAPGNTLDVMIYVIFTLYVVPVLAFAVGFWLLTGDEETAEPNSINITVAALFCACLGLLIHNLIDFAIFEPGVFTVFCAIMACLIALDFQQKSRPLFVLKPAFLTRILMLTGAAVIGWAYLNYALIPVARSAAKIQQASRVISEGEFEVAHNLLADAANEDFLSAAASSVNGRLYLHHFQVDGGKDLDLLSGAKKGLLEAISRNVADFKNFEKLTEVYNDFAELAPQKKGDWLEKAYESAEEAVKRYPNGGHLRIELAEIAEKLGKTDVAIEQYKEAIDIEESYRRQFRQMYPGRAIFSRLGEDKYNFAIERIKELCEKSNR